MFVVLITYKKPLDVVEEFRPAHRKYLQEGYDKNYFVVSGPKTPLTGGVIVSQLKSKEQLQDIIEQDPFFTNQVADFEIIEFTPAQRHPKFAELI